MLKIDAGQMEVFRQQQLTGLDARVDAWLGEQHPRWAATDPGVRAPALRDMIRWADAAGMHAETDFALYCDLMVRVGPTWQQFAGSADAREIVGDTDANPPVKLEELTELAAEMAEATAH